MRTKAKKQAEVTESIGNVFEDLGFEGEEAALLKLRAELVIALEAHIAAKGWSQRGLRSSSVCISRGCPRSPST